jgi:signal peptide peptidase-like 2B
MASNAIAFFMVLMMFKLIRIENYKTAFVLLSLAFFYDIYWVFFSEHIFKKSVMATVATKIDLPMKFVCPYFKPNPFKGCSLIGLGDLVLPGTFIAFCYRWDKKNHSATSQSNYYLVSLIGYFLGLASCMAVLIVY